MTARRLRSLLVFVIFVAAIAKALAELRSKPPHDVSRHPTVDGGAGTAPPTTPAGHEAHETPARHDRTAPPAGPPVPATGSRPTASQPATGTATVETATGSPTGGGDAAPVADRTWAAAVDGACPDGYPVKANLTSGIFHEPGQTSYDRTNPDRCYPSARSATDDGLRPARR